MYPYTHMYLHTHPHCTYISDDSFWQYTARIMLQADASMGKFHHGLPFTHI